MTSGVYAIVNTANGMTYVGSSVNIEKRWVTHRYMLNSGRARTSGMALDWQATHGDGFEFQILEIISGDRDALRDAEQNWLNRVTSRCYNIRRRIGRIPTVLIDGVTVSVRVPRSMTDRVKRLATAQDRTVQAIYTRALRVGLDLEEERHRIACEAIKAAERRPKEAPDAQS